MIWTRFHRSTENMPGTSATLEAEWSLLLAACSEIPRAEKIRPPPSPVTRDRSLEASFRSRRPSRQLSRFSTRLSSASRMQFLAEQMSAETQLYQTNLHKALFLSRELIRIVDHLSALGIEVMSYKGLALAEVAYGDIALRQSGDIDLLIHPAGLAAHPRCRPRTRLHAPLHSSRSGGTCLPAIRIRIGLRRCGRTEPSRSPVGDSTSFLCPRL